MKPDQVPGGLKAMKLPALQVFIARAIQTVRPLH